MSERKSNKLRLDLVSLPATLALAKVMTDCGKPKEQGGKGYEPWDWTHKATQHELLTASKRHIAKYEAGQTFDKETGHNHLAMAFFGLMASLHMDLTGIGDCSRNPQNAMSDQDINNVFGEG